MIYSNPPVADNKNRGQELSSYDSDLLLASPLRTEITRAQYERRAACPVLLYFSSRSLFAANSIALEVYTLFRPKREREKIGDALRDQHHQKRGKYLS